MKLITDHLGQIIAVIAAISLLITSIVFFKGPIGLFFENIIEKETSIGDKVFENLENVGMFEGEGGAGGSGGTGGDEGALGPGLYDADDNLLISWDDMVNTYGLDVEQDYDYYDVTMGGNPSAYINAIPTDVYTLGSKLVVGNVSRMGDNVLVHSSYITTIVLPKRLTSIGSDTFQDCHNLANINIPSSVTSIGEEVFCQCNNLTSVTFEGTMAQWNAITKDPNWARESYSLTEIVCTDGIVSLT